MPPTVNPQYSPLSALHHVPFKVPGSASVTRQRSSVGVSKKHPQVRTKKPSGNKNLQHTPSGDSRFTVQAPFQQRCATPTSMGRSPVRGLSESQGDAQNGTCPPFTRPKLKNTPCTPKRQAIFPSTVVQNSPHFANHQTMPEKTQDFHNRDVEERFQPSEILTSPQEFLNVVDKETQSTAQERSLKSTSLRRPFPNSAASFGSPACFRRRSVTPVWKHTGHPINQIPIHNQYSPIISSAHSSSTSTVRLDCLTAGEAVSVIPNEELGGAGAPHFPAGAHSVGYEKGSSSMCYSSARAMDPFTMPRSSVSPKCSDVRWTSRHFTEAKFHTGTWASPARQDMIGYSAPNIELTASHGYCVAKPKLCTIWSAAPREPPALVGAMDAHQSSHTLSCAPCLSSPRGVARMDEIQRCPLNKSILCHEPVVSATNGFHNNLITTEQPPAQSFTNETPSLRVFREQSPEVNLSQVPVSSADGCSANTKDVQADASFSLSALSEKCRFSCPEFASCLPAIYPVPQQSETRSLELINFVKNNKNIVTPVRTEDGMAACSEMFNTPEASVSTSSSQHNQQKKNVAPVPPLAPLLSTSENLKKSDPSLPAAESLRRDIVFEKIHLQGGLHVLEEKSVSPRERENSQSENEECESGFELNISETFQKRQALLTTSLPTTPRPNVGTFDYGSQGFWQNWFASIGERRRPLTEEGSIQTATEKFPAFRTPYSPQSPLLDLASSPSMKSESSGSKKNLAQNDNRTSALNTSGHPEKSGSVSKTYIRDTTSPLSPPPRSRGHHVVDNFRARFHDALLLASPRNAVSQHKIETHNSEAGLLKEDNCSKTRRLSIREKLHPILRSDYNETTTESSNNKARKCSMSNDDSSHRFNQDITDDVPVTVAPVTYDESRKRDHVQNLMQHSPVLSTTASAASFSNLDILQRHGYRGEGFESPRGVKHENSTVNSKNMEMFEDESRVVYASECTLNVVSPVYTPQYSQQRKRRREWAFGDDTLNKSAHPSTPTSPRHSGNLTSSLTQDMSVEKLEASQAPDAVAESVRCSLTRVWTFKVIYVNEVWNTCWKNTLKAHTCSVIPSSSQAVHLYAAFNNSSETNSDAGPPQTSLITNSTTTDHEWKCLTGFYQSTELFDATAENIMVSLASKLDGMVQSKFFGLSAILLFLITVSAMQVLSIASWRSGVDFFIVDVLILCIHILLLLALAFYEYFQLRKVWCLFTYQGASILVQMALHHVRTVLVNTLGSEWVKVFEGYLLGGKHPEEIKKFHASLLPLHVAKRGSSEVPRLTDVFALSVAAAKKHCAEAHRRGQSGTFLKKLLYLKRRSLALIVVIMLIVVVAVVLVFHAPFLIFDTYTMQQRDAALLSVALLSMSFYFSFLGWRWFGPYRYYIIPKHKALLVMLVLVANLNANDMQLYNFDKKENMFFGALDLWMYETLWSGSQESAVQNGSPKINSIPEDTCALATALEKSANDVKECIQVSMSPSFPCSANDNDRVDNTTCAVHLTFGCIGPEDLTQGVYINTSLPAVKNEDRNITTNTTNVNFGDFENCAVATKKCFKMHSPLKTIQMATKQFFRWAYQRLVYEGVAVQCLGINAFKKSNIASEDLHFFIQQVDPTFCCCCAWRRFYLVSRGGTELPSCLRDMGVKLYKRSQPLKTSHSCSGCSVSQRQSLPGSTFAPCVSVEHVSSGKAKSAAVTDDNTQHHRNIGVTPHALTYDMGITSLREVFPENWILEEKELRFKQASAMSQPVSHKTSESVSFQDVAAYESDSHSGAVATVVMRGDHCLSGSWEKPENGRRFKKKSGGPQQEVSVRLCLAETDVLALLYVITFCSWKSSQQEI